MNQLERYLNQATRGLWGRRKKEVREELEGHILERVERYQIGGMQYEEAVARAIAELGTPKAVSAGMFKLYVAPLLAGSSVLMAMLMTVSIFLLSSGVAQLEPTRQGPMPFCPGQTFNSNCIPDWGQQWIPASSFNQISRNLGLELRWEGDCLLGGKVNPRVCFPPKKQGDVPMTEVFQRSGETYVNLDLLVNFLSYFSGAEVSIEGWDNPTLRVAGKPITLGDSKTPIDAYAIYRSRVFQIGGSFLGPNSKLQVGYVSSSAGGTGFSLTHTIRVTDPPGTVYGILTPYFSANPANGTDLLLFGDAAQVRPDGTLKIQMPLARVRFVKDLAVMLEDALKLKGPEPTAVILVRMNGNLDSARPGYEIVIPANPISEATR